MLNEFNSPKCFWAEVVHTSCYVLNLVILRPEFKKTPYELWRGRKPNILYFKVFGSKYFILNTKDNLKKFESKSDVGFFLRYFSSNKVYIVYNNITLYLEESIHIILKETHKDKINDILDDINESVQYLSLNDRTPMKDNKKEMIKNQPNTSHQQDIASNSFVQLKELRYVRSHPPKLIIGNPFKGTKTRASLRNINEHCAFASHIDPKSFLEAKKGANWILAMQNEQNQFERNNIWELVPKPKNQSIIGIKWIFRNKIDNHGTIIIIIIIIITKLD